MSRVFILLLKIVVVVMISLSTSSCGFKSDRAGYEDNSITESTKYVESDEKTNAWNNMQFKIGTTILSFKYAFPSAIKDIMVEESKMRGVELLVYDGEDKAENQVKNVKEMINEKVDAIILNPVDANECVEAVELAYKAGIPVIGVNTIVNSNKLISYIGSNDVEAGKLQMKYIAEYIGGKGNIVVITGIEGQSSQVHRMEGVNKILQSYPDIKILARVTGNWEREQTYSVTGQLFDKFGMDINAIICQNDEMALGAAEYLEERGLIDKIPVVGVDAIPEALKAIKEGKIQATVFQDSVAQGRTAVDVTIKHLKGEKVAKIYYIPFRLVTKENVDRFLK